MLEIFSIFFFKAVKTNTKICNIFTISFKQKKEKLLFLITENNGDRVLSVYETKIPAEYREKHRRIKYLKSF